MLLFDHINNGISQPEGQKIYPRDDGKMTVFCVVK